MKLDRVFFFLAGVVALGYFASNGTQTTPVVAQETKKAEVVTLAPASFADMLADTGCESRFSDEKKADLFASQYKDHLMTVSGSIEVLSNGSLGIKVNPHTFTYDVDVKLSSAQDAYNMIKGSRVTVTFTVSKHGGCFLPFRGVNGVVKS
jgi:hypothetical protein